MRGFKLKKLKHKRVYAVLTILVLLLVAAAYFGKAASDKRTGGTYLPKAENSVSASPSSSPSSSNPTPSSSTSQATAPNSPIPVASAGTTSPGRQITIKSPFQGSTVTDGTTISGTTTANQLNFILKGAKSGQLTSGTIQSVGGVFSFSLAFEKGVTDGQDTGVIEVYTATPEGVRTDNATIAVNIRG